MGMGLLLALFVAGCTPPGPRAVFKGKNLLNSGDYAGAIAQFRRATELLPANAAAWNYLGVAYQKARQPAEAVKAYQLALALNRDLVEAHWNLGTLYLEQNKNDLAQQEFTAYTLRRNNSPEGWLKLGAAQLRLGEIVPAERSFSTVRSLNPDNAEALNGLGLALLERKNPREAIQFFAAANHAHPDLAPPILNLAVTAQQYLHDNRLALQYYHAYLGLTPRPEKWEEVGEIVNALEQGMPVATATPPPALSATEVARSNAAPVPAQTPPSAPTPAPTAANDTHRPAVAVTHPAPTSRPVLVVRSNPAPVAVHPQPVAAPAATSAPPVRTVALQPAPPPATASAKAISPEHPLVEPPPPEAAPAAKPGLWAKIKPAHWFEPQPLDQKYENTAGEEEADTHPASPAARPAKPAAPAFSRYGYLAPARPAAGNRRAASGAFNQARIDEQASRWMEAMQAYRTAAEYDPGWFEAQYNFAVLSYRLGNHRQALGAYEVALAIQPDSTDARYNFALALKAANCVPDAVNELKKLAASNPGEVRVHLALANLCTQKLHDTVQAREQYLKVLDLDPNNPQADDIRHWLSVNAQ
jgi:tetratricopeptide (TPR) repeat protein